MADNHERPGHDDPFEGPQGEGDFPADFFDDALGTPPHPADPADLSDAPGAPAWEPTPEPVRPADAGLTRPGAAAAEELPPPGSPWTYKAPDDAPTEYEGVKAPLFPVVIGVLMLGAIVAAWFMSRQAFEKPAAPVAAAPAPAPVPEAADPAPAAAVMAGAPAPANEALEGKLKEVEAKYDELARQFKSVEGRVDDLAKKDVPDVAPIQKKVDDLAKQLSGVAPAAEKVEALDKQVDSVDGALKSVKDEVASLKDEVKKIASAPAPARPSDEAAGAAAGAATATGGDDVAAGLGQGGELFKAGKYKEAGEVFKKLEAGSPKDARVYYYAALANGLNTGKWDGETLSTAARGAALEKSGETKASDVDATFADLAPTLKPWLAFFRKQAK